MFTALRTFKFRFRYGIGAVRIHMGGNVAVQGLLSTIKIRKSVDLAAVGTNVNFYGEEISKEKLEMVGDAEKLLRNLGFNQLRVRIHGKVARIELEPQDFSKFLEEKTRLMVDRELKRMGFSYVSLDILGYRTGSMNEGMLQG